MLTREQAYEIARKDALAHGLGSEIQAVLLPEEITSSKPVVYGVKLENCWVAYIEQSGSPSICSSKIVILERKSGNILYRGRANDEG